LFRHALSRHRGWANLSAGLPDDHLAASDAILAGFGSIVPDFTRDGILRTTPAAFSTI
jgi:hypothetical protein